MIVAAAGRQRGERDRETKSAAAVDPGLRHTSSHRNERVQKPFLFWLLGHAGDLADVSRSRAKRTEDMLSKRPYRLFTTLVGDAVDPLPHERYVPAVRAAGRYLSAQDKS